MEASMVKLEVPRAYNNRNSIQGIREAVCSSEANVFLATSCYCFMLEKMSSRLRGSDDFLERLWPVH